MGVDEIRQICLSLPASEECFPFNETTLVFKVAGKMFLLIDIDSPNQVTIKAAPEIALELREQFDWVLPGYHMSQKHWITLELEKANSHFLVKDWILNSYGLVYKGLTQKKRAEIEGR
ncbi:MAG: MmcQ/YjbR family DNA-binding protein [Flavobacteriia bacterium]|jgi:predicted DNA-binding protein (MmcQ/YjbR family)|nr:MmcQ/YjbR family DNA-binding protein [Flavobacteriia bacterium]NBV90978.1 MmcQ/YjbR family DNA-binding protein [Flavobacteriia bacterium]NBY41597.1 MmcQ/YjbR family DNA-binding protein [Flavobacteriia bacterium]